MQSVPAEEIPRIFNIPVDMLFGGLKSLFTPTVDFENNETDAQALAFVFLRSAIGLIEKTISYQTADYDVLEILQNYRIPYERYHGLIMELSSALLTPAHQLNLAIEALRYHYVVDTSYQLIGERTLQVKLYCTEPSRNLTEVLRAEVIKAQERNEFVPYKYLEIAGLE
jgi:hypothetical protein